MEESTTSAANNLTNVTNISNFSKTKDSLTYSSLTNCSNLTTRTNLSNAEIESRRSGFEKFITSLPKICSPTICGTLNYQTPNSRFLYSTELSSNQTSIKNQTKQTKLEEDTSGYQTLNSLKLSSNLNSQVSTSSKSNLIINVFDQIKEENIDEDNKKEVNKNEVNDNEDNKNEINKNEIDNNEINKNEVDDNENNDKFINTFEEKINKQLNGNDSKSGNEFDWSIDQIALLNPCDITFDDNFLIYKEFEELNKSLLKKESEKFFEQKLIAPSPVVNTPILARKRSFIQNFCKTSSPFIDYLNSKQCSSSKIYKTPLQLSKINSSSFKTPLNYIQKQINSNTPINNELTDNKLNLPKKKLFHKFDSTNSLNSINNSHLKCNNNSILMNTMISPALSEITPNNQLSINNKFNCTELDCRNFSLDLSGICNHELEYIKSSTNRKNVHLKRVKEEDECVEEENEIKALNLSDTDEDDNELNDKIELNLEQNKIELNSNNINELNLNNNNNELNLTNNNELNLNNDNDELNNKTIEDVQMNSISIQFNPNNNQNNTSTSFMECSFVKEVNKQETNNQFKNDEQKNDNNLELLNNQSAMDMETDCIYLDSNNFDNNNKIDPSNCKTFKNQHLTSTPFRF